MVKVYDDIEITKEDGTTIKMKVLFTFKDGNSDKEYVLYYNPDDPKDDRVYAYRYDQEGNLFEIETEEEWNKIEFMYENYMENLSEEE